MKKWMMALGAAIAAVAALADPMPRSEWQAKVGEAAQNAAVLKQTIGKLSAADQCAFTREVNQAVQKKPASKADKEKAFLEANRAAIEGATPANRATVLAEIFATVPPENLPAITENFSSELFNRNANPEVKFTDAEYLQIAENVLKKVSDRCASADRTDVRTGFAIVMFVKASNGSPAGLDEKLGGEFLSEGSQKMAKDSWFPAALGEGRRQSYGPMLGENATESIAVDVKHPAVVHVDTQQLPEAMLADLAATSAPGKNADGTPKSGSAGASESSAAGAFEPPAIAGVGGAADMGGGESGVVPRDRIFNKTLPDGSPNPYYKEERGDPRPYPKTDT